MSFSRTSTTEGPGKKRSYLIFLSFVFVHETGFVDVSRVFSRECYDLWLKNRHTVPKNPEESFRKALTSHCTGVDGRKPFPADVESALLVKLREPEAWQCFQGTECNIGARGFQLQGYWEKQKNNDISTLKSLKSTPVSTSAFYMMDQTPSNLKRKIPENGYGAVPTDGPRSHLECNYLAPIAAGDFDGFTEVKKMRQSAVFVKDMLDFTENQNIAVDGRNSERRDSLMFDIGYHAGSSGGSSPTTFRMPSFCVRAVASAQLEFDQFHVNQDSENLTSFDDLQIDEDLKFLFY